LDISTIEPITEVRLLTAVPLDNTYKHTRTFSNTTEQYGFFNGKVKTAFSNLKPSKLVNAVELTINAYSIYDCNYMMFKNANFSNKWLYAFITNIAYISVNCSKIYFELDVLQTWYFNYTMNECFVVREHVSDDSIGANIIDEGLEVGEFVANGLMGSGVLDDLKIVMAVTPPKGSDDTTFTGVVGATYCGIYSGLQYWLYPANAAGVINDDIMTLCGNGHGDRIVAIFMCPNALVVEAGSMSANVWNIDPITRPTVFGDYTPKNNKLYTYPYSFLYVSNNQGNSAVYKYEYMDDKTNPQFLIKGEFSVSPTVYLFPVGYKGLSVNYEEKLTMGNYPLCSWSNDVYANWLAQNRNSRNLAYLTDTVKAASGVITGNAAVAGDGIMGVLGNMAQQADKSIQPLQARGNTSGGGAAMAVGIQDFYFIPMSVNKEYAQKIDDFFNVFGYKVNAVKVPNINSRTSWNYVQTKNTTLTGSVPFNDISKIKSIYENGVTFWHGDFIGDYSRNNQ
jgi:transposase-like protein